MTHIPFAARNFSALAPGAMLRIPAVCPGVHRRHVHGGFTLMELLLVIALTAVLAGLALGTLQGVKQHAATARARADLVLLSQALEHYRRLHGDYPQTADSPEKFFAALAGRLGPTGAPLQSRNLADGLGVMRHDQDQPGDATCFVDPWDNPYQFVYFTRQDDAAELERGYVLYSVGPRTPAEPHPTRAEVVPFTTGRQGGVVAATARNSKNLYAGP
jgi:prepilin-type N-terminal cleavage/methylation domain-containing protein